MTKLSQWIAAVATTWFTWLVYISNTQQGTEAQADLVVWLVHIYLLVSVGSLWLEDYFLAQLQPKNHWLEAITDCNLLAQGFLLVVTFHWWLFLVRVGAEWLVRKNCQYAHERIYGRP